MMLNFVCYLDGIKHSGSTVRAAHPFPSLSREYKYQENNDSLPIQIPRCDTHFVQFKEEKLIQLYWGIFFFLERNRNFVYHKDFGRRRVT